MKRIGILRGGTGEDYESSLKEGASLILHIHENLGDKFKVVDIFVDREGVWHANGVPVEPWDLVHKVDVVWNTSDPHFSVALEQFSIPVVGDSSFSSSIADNRAMLGEHMKSLGIEMPRHLVLPLYQASPVAGLRPREDFDGTVEDYAKEKAQEVHKKFAPPWIVRSYAEDPDMGVHVANTFAELERAIKDGIHHEQSILVEELIPGKITSVHSVRGFRDQPFYTFPPLPAEDEPHFSLPEKEILMQAARLLHNHFSAHPYLKSNLVLTPRGKVYVTGMVFNPNLNDNSHFCRSCHFVGAKPHHVIDHILEQTL